MPSPPATLSVKPGGEPAARSPRHSPPAAAERTLAEKADRTSAPRVQLLTGIRGGKMHCPGRLGVQEPRPTAPGPGADSARVRPAPATGASDPVRLLLEAAELHQKKCRTIQLPIFGATRSDLPVASLVGFSGRKSEPEMRAAGGERGGSFG